MAVSLPMFGRPASHSTSAWSAFLRQRDSLTAEMEMSTCDGCNQCSPRCTGGFTVTEAEYRAVQSYLAQQPAEMVRRIAGQKKEMPWPGTDTSTNLSDAPESDGESDRFTVTVTMCRFRDMESGYCTIYPVRPTVCRLFGHTPWLPCPIGAVSQVPDGSLQLWQEYSAFEHRTWEGWEVEDGLQE